VRKENLTFLLAGFKFYLGEASSLDSSASHRLQKNQKLPMLPEKNRFYFLSSVLAFPVMPD
jgi:hypothetical protein